MHVKQNNFGEFFKLRILYLAINISDVIHKVSKISEFDNWSIIIMELIIMGEVVEHIIMVNEYIVHNIIEILIIGHDILFNDNRIKFLTSIRVSSSICF